MSKRHANRLIESAEVVYNLGPIGPIAPTHESQVRPLAGLKPGHQREAWHEGLQFLRFFTGFAFTGTGGKAFAVGRTAMAERELGGFLLCEPDGT